jgi:nucleoside phosphorylase
MSEPCDVLLVFVNNNEKDAVYAACKEKCRRDPGVLYGDVLTYHDFGKISGAKVLGVQIEMGSTTRGGSSAAIPEAIKERTPRYVILVGIAFGMDRKKQHLGDILVSQKLSLYEMRKIGANKQGEDIEIRRGDTAAVPEKILSKFRACSGSQYWKGAPVHFGLLVSGEKLIDNAHFKEKLKKEYPEAIGGEMEAAGAYVAAEFYKRDWIVVKAVCDYADGNKKRNKEKNQKIAAQNAAQLVFHVLEKGNFSKLPYVRTEEVEKKTVTAKPPKESIIKLVEDNITRLLSYKKMEYFYRFLKEQLNKDRNESKDYTAAEMAAILTGMDVVAAVLTLDLAVKECLEVVGDSEGNPDLANCTWNESLGIVGWLVLLGVDDEWAEATSRQLAEKNEPLNLVIPVNTEAGAETAFSRLKQARADLDLDKASKKVKGKKGIHGDAWIIEEGWDTDDKVFSIKKMLYKQLLKTEPPVKGVLSEDYITRELKQTLFSRSKKGEHYYLAVNLSSKDNPLLAEDVCKYLIHDLGLEIFLIGSQEQSVAIVLEPELNAQLREFFRNKPQ